MRKRNEVNKINIYLDDELIKSIELNDKLSFKVSGNYLAVIDYKTLDKPPFGIYSSQLGCIIGNTIKFEYDKISKEVEDCRLILGYENDFSPSLIGNITANNNKLIVTTKDYRTFVCDYINIDSINWAASKSDYI